MLITRLICIQCPTITILLIEILIFFSEHSVMFTCSKEINAFKRQNSWTDTFRKSSKINDSLIFPELSSQNMRGFDHETILSPSFHGVRKERLAQWPPICDPKTTKKSEGYFQKNWVGMCGTLPKTLTLFQTKICDFPYHISDLIKNLIPIWDLKPWSPARDRSAWQAVMARTR